MNNEDEEEVTAESLYDRFFKTTDFLPTLEAFQDLCDLLDINTKNYKTVFTSIKSRLKSWKCQTLFNKLDKKAKHVDYKNRPCAKLKVLIIGAGPVGLRTAIEVALLGAHVIVIEKRDTFSRNNVLHLWPFLIVDLKAVGVKSFFGKFCAGSLDHISIRRLQCILLKVCLLLGVQVYPQVMFTGLVEPNEGKGWKGSFKPKSSPLNSIEFDVVVGCDGKGNSLKFGRKEFRGKLAIAITCNFVNKQTSEEARVEEISGVAFIYNQEFFQQLTDQTGVDLENIVYYKDETHYFVMTAKKKSLLSKGVIKQDCKDVFKLLSAENISHDALLQYAKEAADFSTKYQLPHHEFAKNHYGKEDVAMFDFTSIHQAQSSSKILERKGKRLLLCIAGDVLLEPFWPTGSGCARGFLGAFDAAWMIRGLGLGRDSLDLIQERESIFTILPQSKPGSLIRHQDRYSIDPATRYLNLNARRLRKEQVQHLLDTTDKPVDLENWPSKSLQKDVSKPVKVKKNEEKEVDPSTLLKWCKEQTADYPNIKLENMSTSWKNGLAFCAIINRYRPHLIDYFSLDPDDVEGNCEKAFTIAEEHLGIPPKISSHDIVNEQHTNQLAIMAYVSLYYEALKHETPVTKKTYQIPQTANGEIIENSSPPKSPTSKMSILSKLSRRSKKTKTKLNKKSKKDKESQLLSGNENSVSLKSYEKKTGIVNESFSTGDLGVISSNDENLMKQSIAKNQSDENSKDELRNPTAGQNKYKRISQLAESVFGDSIVQEPNQKAKPQTDVLTESEKCFFCSRKVYVMERQSAEGLFFHRKCFRCIICKCQLLIGNYAYADDDDDDKSGKFYCKMHYNRLIYQPKVPSNQENNRVIKTADRRRRPVTQIIQPSDVHQAFQSKSTDVVQLSPKFSRQIRDIQTQLKENLPELKVKNRMDKPVDVTITNADSVDGNTQSEKGPYDRFEARSVLDRHPSLLRCAPKQVTINSFLTSSKLSISTPNLTKLIQEDSMFAQERKRHEEKLSNPIRKKVPLTSDLESINQNTERAIRKKLSVSDELRTYSFSREDINDGEQDTHGSDVYLDQNKSFNLNREDSYGAVHRRPLEERRAQYPVSMAFTEGLIASGLRPVSVNIDIDETVEMPKKKKKLVLKKKKAKKNKELTIEEGNEAEQPPSPKKHTEKHKSLERSFEKSYEKSPRLDKGKGVEQKGERDDDWILVKPEDIKTDEEVLSSSSSSEEEVDEKSGGLFRRALRRKAKKKEVSPEDLAIQEAKKKRHEKKKIQKEMKERELKRLWEAQSIQRKLNEVDVRQFELEERGKKVEKELQDPTMSKEKTNNLMFEWFHLVNEKNTLLRFESELVIQSNSIQLEDRQARLEQQIRNLLTAEKPKPNSHDEIDRLTKELVDTVEQRNALVELLEEDRLREMEEDRTLKEVFAQKAHDLGMDRLI